MTKYLGEEKAKRAFYRQCKMMKNLLSSLKTKKKREKQKRGFRYRPCPWHAIISDFDRFSKKKQKRVEQKIILKIMELTC